MIRIGRVLFFSLLLAWLAPFGALADGGGRTVIPFDQGWRFHLGEAPGAPRVDFADGDWREVDLPHDWSIEGAIDVRNPSGQGQAFLPMGVGWYRKTFDAPADLGDRQLWIEFDGAMQDSTVWLNGQKLGERPDGYVTFRYDLTPFLKGQRKNVLAVRVDNSRQPSSRWYAGSGITRHVRLIEMDSFHFKNDSIFISVSDAVSASPMINISGSYENDGKQIRHGRARIQFLPPSGGPKGLYVTQDLEVDPGRLQNFAAGMSFDNAPRWNAGGDGKEPMFKALVSLEESGRIIDECDVPFGVRSAEFKPNTGFWLNGENIKIKGVCLHVDGGGVGAAVPMGVWERRLDALRSLGVNAVRTSHNPPDPAFLDLLDRKGFLVMHEIFDTWNTAKVPGDYAHLFSDWWQRDLTDTLERDRNHPCIVIYSAGNEIHDGVAAQLKLFPQIRDLYHRIDSTRPVTLAMLQADRPGGGFTNGLAGLQDVVGANYRPAQLVALQKENPTWKIIETEANYGAAELPALFENPQLSGEFLWTGVDYLGESMSAEGIGQGFGLIDRTGEIRARGYEHAQWWSDQPMVKIARVIGPASVNLRDIGGGRVCDWTPENVQPHAETVEVYSNCDEVELFLNGQPLGKKDKPANRTRSWKVPFAAGAIRAVGKNKGNMAATDELRTAGPATKLTLTADETKLTTAWDDVCYLRVNVADDAGVRNPNASDLITFSIEGPGKIMAVDNGDLDSHESFRGNQRRAYAGTCIAVIKATGPGEITVRAEAAGLSEASAIINGK